MKYIKHLPELNKLTFWYVTLASGFLGWYVAFLIKDCRYFCCCSKINLMKGKFFFGKFQAFWRSLWNWSICLCWCNTISFSFKRLFLWWIWHFFQIFYSFGSFYLVYLLKAHTKVNDKSDSMNWNRGILRKIKMFYYWLTNGFFYLLTFNFRADIMTRYIFNQVWCFFSI